MRLIPRHSGAPMVLGLHVPPVLLGRCALVDIVCGHELDTGPPPMLQRLFFPAHLQTLPHAAQAGALPKAPLLAVLATFKAHSSAAHVHRVTTCPTSETVPLARSSQEPGTGTVASSA
jgi:hypothetical protein